MALGNDFVSSCRWKVQRRDLEPQLRSSSTFVAFHVGPHTLGAPCVHHAAAPSRAHWEAYGMKVSRCINWYQSQFILTACKVWDHCNLWDNRRTGQLNLDSKSESPVPW